ncbi:MAG: hypothetical protein BWY72_02541 [Bacteroidetes bacterium ADurb.Bin416]|nr:MAG: hypothetical protein BWY72_02541 [Bacteroidetes bacterium ADurb.Bin416]
MKKSFPLVKAAQPVKVGLQKFGVVVGGGLFFKKPCKPSVFADAGLFEQYAFTKRFVPDEMNFPYGIPLLGAQGGRRHEEAEKNGQKSSEVNHTQQPVL